MTWKKSVKEKLSGSLLNNFQNKENYKSRHSQQFAENFNFDAQKKTIQQQKNRKTIIF